MTFLVKEKLFSKKWFISNTLIVVGSFILAAGFVFFINPYNIVPGAYMASALWYIIFREAFFHSGLPVYPSACLACY